MPRSLRQRRASSRTFLQSGLGRCRSFQSCKESMVQTASMVADMALLHTATIVNAFWIILELDPFFFSHGVEKVVCEWLQSPDQSMDMFF